MRVPDQGVDWKLTKVKSGRIRYEVPRAILRTQAMFKKARTSPESQKSYTLMIKRAPLRWIDCISRFWLDVD